MRARITLPRYAIGLYWMSTVEQGQSGLGLEAQQASVRLSSSERAGRWWRSTPTSPAARTTGGRASRRHRSAADSSVRCWSPLASTGSPGGRTPTLVAGERRLNPRGDMPGEMT